MHLSHLDLQSFRGLRNVSLHLTPGWTLLTGEASSGKTTLLQAIASILGRATRSIRPSAALQWPGFDPLATQGSRVKADVQFGEEELVALNSLFDQWVEVTQQEPPHRPGQFDTVSLLLRGDRVLAEQGKEAFFQFFGRYYLRQLIAHRAKAVRWFDDVGEVFWLHPGYIADNAMSMTRKALLKRDACDIIGSMTRELLPYLTIDGVYAGLTTDALPGVDCISRGERVAIDYLSDTERYLIGLIGFCVRMHPGNAVVLIDDFDRHLDDELMMNTIALLQDRFPKTQFIATCKYVPETYEGAMVCL